MFINFDQTFYNFGLIKNNFIKNASFGKDTALEFRFGKDMPVIPNVNYLAFIEGHHQGVNPMPVRVPIPYEDYFMSYVKSFYKWLYDNLKATDTLKYLAYLKISFANQSTYECRFPDQDKTGIGNDYVNAAEKWLSANYTVDKALMSVCEIMEFISQTYRDVLMCLPVIVKNGFPCIDKNGRICLPKQREKSSEWLISYGVASYPNFCPQTTYFDTGVSDFVITSGSSNIIQQGSNLKFGSYTPENPKGVIEYGKSLNLYGLELFERTLINFPELK